MKAQMNVFCSLTRRKREGKGTRRSIVFTTGDVNESVAQNAKARSAADEANRAETAAAGVTKLDAPPLLLLDELVEEPVGAADEPEPVAEPAAADEPLLLLPRVAVELAAANDDEAVAAKLVP